MEDDYDVFDVLDDVLDDEASLNSTDLPLEGTRSCQLLWDATRARWIIVHIDEWDEINARIKVSVCEEDGAEHGATFAFRCINDIIHTVMLKNGLIAFLGAGLVSMISPVPGGWEIGSGEAVPWGEHVACGTDHGLMLARSHIGFDGTVPVAHITPDLHFGYDDPEHGLRLEETLVSLLPTDDTAGSQAQHDFTAVSWLTPSNALQFAPFKVASKDDVTLIGRRDEPRTLVQTAVHGHANFETPVLRVCGGLVLTQDAHHVRLLDWARACVVQTWSFEAHGEIDAVGLRPVGHILVAMKPLRGEHGRLRARRFETRHVAWHRTLHYHLPRAFRAAVRTLLAVAGVGGPDTPAAANDSLQLPARLPAEVWELVVAAAWEQYTEACEDDIPWGEMCA